MSDAEIRASDAEREHAAEGLREHFAAGRLHADELSERIDAVYNAKTVAELERLGVRRVSVGSGPMRASMGLTQRIAKELKEHGTFASMTEGAMPYLEANQLFMK